ncbi:MAG: FkbM family methyltransferase [Pseudomonadales bacterium]
MKLKNYLELFGFRAKARHYGFEDHEFDLACGRVSYAQWQHPKETRKAITDVMVDAYHSYIGEGDFCIDIGAHTGDSTLPMAIAATPSGCALAMEPNPFVYHVLEKNARANSGIANIETIMAAVTQQDGFVEFEYSDAGYCNGGRHENISPLQHGHAYKLEVFGINLERELRLHYAERLPRLKFVKVDTEGFDLYVLRSLEQVLAETRPAIKAEVFKETDAEYRAGLLAFLNGLGYEVYKIVAEPITPGPLVTRDNLMDWPHYDILALASKS